MGLKGLVRRGLDGHFVHANIDTDVIIGDIPPGQDTNGLDSTAKPIELYEIIERFCLGRRKLELFGTERNVRPGWLTVGLDLKQTVFNPREYSSWFEGQDQTWDGTSASDATHAASFLGYSSSQVRKESQVINTPAAINDCTTKRIVQSGPRPSWRTKYLTGRESAR